MSKISRILADKLREEYQTDGMKTSVLSDIFEDEPVPLNTFLYDHNYLNLKITLSDIQTDFVRHFEQIYSPETYIALVEQLGPEFVPVKLAHTIVGLWSKGAGKDLCARLGIARVADKLLNLRSPQTYYGLPETDEIQAINVAVSAPQAHKAFFRPMVNLFTNSPRFKDKFRGDPPTHNAKSILLVKNLELISGHSQAESQEGLNLIAAIADEIGAFPTEAEKLGSSGRVNVQTAEYIVDMLRSSAATRFPNNYKLALISYPRYEGDAIMTAAKDGLADIAAVGEENSSYYVSGPYATWEVNPRVKREDFAEDYRKDPEFAAAKYECKPPKAAARYIRSDIALLNGFSRVEDEPVTFDYYWGLPEHEPNTHITPTEGWQVKFEFSPSFKPMEGAAYALHGDIALKADRAGIAMSHVSQMRKHPYDETKDDQPVVKVDFVTAFEADLGVEVDGEVQPREVKISWYRQLVFELLSRGFNIERVTFDGWQSINMIQELSEWGIASEVVSLDRNTKVYDEFKGILYDSRINGPMFEPVIDELSRLSKVNGNKIDHPPNGSKDFADAVAGSVFGAVQLKGTEGEEPKEVDLSSHNMLGMDKVLGPDIFLTPIDTTLGPNFWEGGARY